MTEHRPRALGGILGRARSGPPLRRARPDRPVRPARRTRGTGSAPAATWIRPATWVRAGVVAVAAALVLAWSPAAATAAPPTAGPVLRVMPLGDSITWGVGSSTTSSYRLPLWNLVAGQSRYAVRFVGSQASGSLPDPANEGHSGYTIQQIRDGVDSWTAAARPDVVLLHIGINDYNRNLDTATAPARFADLVDRIFADRPGVTVLAMGLIPTTPGLESAVAPYNAAAKALEATEQQAGKKYRYVEPPALTPAEMTDNLHPDDAGYQRMANAFYPALDQAFTDGWATGGRRPARAPSPAPPGRSAGATSTATAAPTTSPSTRPAPCPSTSTAAATAAAAGPCWARSRPVRPPTRAGSGSRTSTATARSTTCCSTRTAVVSVWLNRGGDGHGGWLPLGQVATGLTTDATHVRFADFDGDGRTDYVLLNADGSRVGVAEPRR